MPHNSNPQVSAHTSLQPSPAEIRRLGRVVSASTWTIAAVVILFSAITATRFVAAHGTPGWAAPLVGVATDAAFVMSLTADSFLSRYALADAGAWPRALRWFTGAATVFLNDGLAVAEADYVAVAIHTIAPVLLLLLAEAAPAYRRAFAGQHHGVDPSTAVTIAVNTVNEPIDTTVDDDTARTNGHETAQVNPIVLTPVDLTPGQIQWGARPDAETAARIIEDGWVNGASVSEVAHLAQRDKSYVSRKFAALTAARGPRQATAS